MTYIDTKTIINKNSNNNINYNNDEKDIGILLVTHVFGIKILIKHTIFSY